MANSDNNSIGSQIKQNLRKFELYLERNSAFQIAFYVLGFGSLLIGRITNIYNVLLPNWTPIHTASLFLFVVAALLLIDYKHVRMLDNRMTEIEKRDNHIKSLRDALAYQTHRLEVPYKNQRLSWYYDILPDGDGICKRECTISPKDQAIYLFTIIAGVTDNSPELLKSGDLKFKIYSLDANNRSIPLIHYLVEDSARRKRICIVMDSPITTDSNARVTAEYTWPGLWQSLIHSGEDRGSINVEHDIEHLGLSIKVPFGYEITGFSVNPDIGSYEVRADADSRYIVRWEAINVKGKQLISYRIFTRKNN